MGSIKNVIDVISFDDSDKTCKDGIKKAILKFPGRKLKFANGGDRNNSTTLETVFCKENNIELIWKVGGSDKSNSSSWILKRWNEK